MLDRHAQHQQATHPVEVRSQRTNVGTWRGIIVRAMSYDLVMAIARLSIHGGVQMEMGTRGNHAADGEDNHEDRVLPVFCVCNKKEGDGGEEDGDDRNTDAEVVKVFELIVRVDRNSIKERK